MAGNGIDLEKLDRMGVRCSLCEHWQDGACWVQGKATYREADCKICDDFRPDQFNEFWEGETY